MTDEPKGKNRPPDEIQEIRENARIGYRVAIDLLAHEANWLWSKFNAFLVVNSVILGSTGLSMNARYPLQVFSKGLPIMGAVLCLLWFPLFSRSWRKHNYWIYAARELEEKYLSGPINLLSRGRDFAEGKAVKFEMGDGPMEYQIKSPGRLLRIKNISTAAIGLFFVMYVAILIEIFVDC